MVLFAFVMAISHAIVGSVLAFACLVLSRIPKTWKRCPAISPCVLSVALTVILASIGIKANDCLLDIENQAFAYGCSLLLILGATFAITSITVVLHWKRKCEKMIESDFSNAKRINEKLCFYSFCVGVLFVLLGIYASIFQSILKVDFFPTLLIYAIAIYPVVVASEWVKVYKFGNREK